VIFFGLFALRAFSPQRRRRQQRNAAPTRSFTNSAPPGGGPAAGDPSRGVTFTGIAPGWLVDPTGRHQQRYWSGSAWTEHVTDGGVPGTDPPPGDSGLESPP
jgi:Protein of unknown function (DUF2510)